MSLTTNRILKGVHRDIRRLIRTFMDEGWAIVRTKKHVVLKKDGRIFSVSKTPSDLRSIQNIRADAAHVLQISL